MNKTVSNLVLILLIMMTGIEQLEARAFCALRDPIESIKKLFPEADRHRSIVRAIDADTRDQISERLPFTLHFNELGKHTLYVAEKQRTPIGFVHVRSELSKWGMIEIAWALNPDLTLHGAFFQRCRVPDCHGDFSRKVEDELSGRSFGYLLKLLSADGQRLIPRLQTVFAGQESLAAATIRSALKTIAVTAIAWKKEVIEINRRLLIQNVFKSDDGLALQPMMVPAGVVDDLSKQMGGGGSAIDKHTIEIFQVTRDMEDIGHIATVDWRNGRFQSVLLSLMDASSKVLEIRSIPSWPNAEIAIAFDKLHGLIHSDGERCTTAAELVGYELDFLVRHSILE